MIRSRRRVGWCEFSSGFRQARGSQRPLNLTVPAGRLKLFFLPRTLPIGIRMNWCGSMKTDTVGRMVVTDKTDLNKRRVSLQHVEVLAGEGVISKVERWLGGRLKDIRAFIEGLYEHDLHAKRVDALAGATGTQRSPSIWWPGMSDARSVGTICQRDGWDRINNRPHQ
jgi:hypothetical protein